MGNQLIARILESFASGVSEKKGLVSEGNWHNCLTGLSMVLADMKSGHAGEHAHEIKLLMSSLWSLNFSPQSRTMVQRVHRGQGARPVDKESLPSLLMGTASAALLWFVTCSSVYAQLN